MSKKEEDYRWQGQTAPSYRQQYDYGVGYDKSGYDNRDNNREYSSYQYENRNSSSYYSGSSGYYQQQQQSQPNQSSYSYDNSSYYSQQQPQYSQQQYSSSYSYPHSSSYYSSQQTGGPPKAPPQQGVPPGPPGSVGPPGAPGKSRNSSEMSSQQQSKRKLQQQQQQFNYTIPKSPKAKTPKPGKKSALSPGPRQVPPVTEDLNNSVTPNKSKEEEDQVASPTGGSGKKGGNVSMKITQYKPRASAGSKAPPPTANQ
eukprot:Pgem_evm1s4041